MNSPCDSCGISSEPSRGTSAAVSSRIAADTATTRPRFSSDQRSAGR